MQHGKKAGVEVVPLEDDDGRRRDANGRYDGKLTADAIGRIGQAVRAGTTLEGAARYAGVDRVTFYRWLTEARRLQDAGALEDRGDDARDSLLARLIGEVDAALADFEVGAVARLQKFGEDQWQPVAWLLERRFPDAYGRRQRIDVEGSDDPRVAALVKVSGGKWDVGALSDEELDTLIDLHLKMAPGRELGEGGGGA